MSELYFKHKNFIDCLICTFIIGMVAYGYVFFNFTPAHDGIMTVTNDQNWQTAIGRGLMQVYVSFRGPVDAPWLIGMLTLLYTGIAVFLTLRLLDIDVSTMNIFILVAVYVLNITYVCSATVYIYLLDIYAMSLLLAVAAVYCLYKIRNKIIAIVVAGVLLSFSMGLYQSYFAVAISLFLIMIARKAIGETETIVSMLKFGCMELSSVFIGAGIYAITLKLIQYITNVEPYDSYNSVSNLSALSLSRIIELIPMSLKTFWDLFFNNPLYGNRIYVIINIILLAISVLAYIDCFINMRLVANRIFLVVTLVIFPLGANCIYILSNGMVHYLMVFSYQMFYVLMLLPFIVNKADSTRKIWGVLERRLITGLIAVLSIIVIRFSNDISYYQKLVGEGTAASINNILYDIERYPDFNKETMPIIVIGEPGEALAQEYDLQDFFGCYPGVGAWGTTITYKSVFQSYFHFILGRNYNFDYTEETEQKIRACNEYGEMPVYPSIGYIRVIDGYLVIKFE